MEATPGHLLPAVREAKSFGVQGTPGAEKILGSGVQEKPAVTGYVAFRRKTAGEAL